MRCERVGACSACVVRECVHGLCAVASVWCDSVVGCSHLWFRECVFEVHFSCDIARFVGIFIARVTLYIGCCVVILILFDLRDMRFSSVS